MTITLKEYEDEKKEKNRTEEKTFQVCPHCGNPVRKKTKAEREEDEKIPNPFSTYCRLKEEREKELQRSTASQDKSGDSSIESDSTTKTKERNMPSKIACSKCVCCQSFPHGTTDYSFCEKYKAKLRIEVLETRKEIIKEAVKLDVCRQTYLGNVIDFIKQMIQDWKINRMLRRL